MDKGHAPRAGNVQRAKWRYKCRQTLADYLRKDSVLPKNSQVLTIT
jgi:hypothetical protein